MKIRNKKGVLLLETVIGIIMLGSVVLALMSSYSQLSRLDDNNSDTNKASLILDNFFNEVRNKQYKTLKNEYQGKTFNNYLNSGYKIITEVERRGPCSKKDVCDYTIVKAKIYDGNNKLVDEKYVHRALTHMNAKNSQIYPVDSIVDIPLPVNVTGIRFKIWGAGGGGGGANEGYGRDGGAGAYIEGSYDVESTDKLQLLVGSAGKTGDSCVRTFNQNRAGIYGTGGNGGGTGYQGCSGAGGAGGGSSWLKVNGEIIALAGGGGGGAGGSMDVPGGTVGSTCSTQATSASLRNGETSPVDGGGGGGGGGGYEDSGTFGGKGGIWGQDRGRASTAGCYGLSYIKDASIMTLTNPYGRFPANQDDPLRQFAGQGGEGAVGNYAHEVNNPAKSGRIVLFIQTESQSAI